MLTDLPTSDLGVRLLDGGDELITCAGTSLGLVSLRIVFQRGSAEEDALAGATDVAMRLVHFGTRERSWAEQWRAFERLAAWPSFSVGRWTTRLELTVLEATLEPALTLLLQALRETADAPADLAHLQASLAESAAAALTSPREALNDQLALAMYPGHPYGIPTAGFARTRARLEPHSVAQHRQAVLASPAFVGIAADEPQSVAGPVLAFLEALREHVGRGQAQRPQVPPVAWDRVVALAYPAEDHAVVTAALPGPRADDARAAAYALWLDIVGGGHESPLFRRLRAEEGLSYSLGVAWEASVWSGVTLFDVEPSHDRAAYAVRAARESWRRAAEQVDGLDLDGVKARWRARWLIDLETPADRLEAALETRSQGLAAQELWRWPERIAAVTRQDLAAVAREFGFGRDELLVVAALKRGAADPGWAVELPDLETLAASPTDLL